MRSLFEFLSTNKINIVKATDDTIRNIVKSELDRLGYWSGDIDYLRGYLLVDKMSTEERDKLIRWNIGPDQFYIMDTFEKFFQYNAIPKISNKRLNEIKKNYKDLPK